MTMMYASRDTPATYMFYESKPVCDAVESGFSEYFYPKNDLRSGVLEFVVEGNKDHFIVPSKTYLKLGLELSGTVPKAAGETADRTVADGTAKASVINNIFHSVFESVEVEVDNVATVKSDRNYPYVAYLQTLCNYGEEPLSTYFELSGWSKDTAGKMDDITGTKNEGFKNRRAMFQGPGTTAEFIGRLWSPLFTQHKALPTQCTMRVILRKASDTFALMHEAGEFKLSITSAVLMVQKVKPVDKLKDATNQMLDEDHAIPYFLRVPTINHMTIDAGSSQFVRDNLFLGKLPERVVIGMVATDAYHGKFNKNPFNFEHFGLSEICLYKDGTAFPRPMIKLDIQNKQCADAYHSFLDALNASHAEFAPDITMKEYMNGYTLFVYDMSPDQMGHPNPSSLTPTNSNVRLEMKFKEPTEKNITLLVYSQRHHLMEVYRNRQVVVEV